MLKYKKIVYAGRKDDACRLCPERKTGNHRMFDTTQNEGMNMPLTGDELKNQEKQIKNEIEKAFSDAKAPGNTDEQKREYLARAIALQRELQLVG